MSVDTLPERVANLEGRVEEHHSLFERLETRLQTIENRLNHLDEKMESKFSSVYALVATAWVSILLALAAVFFKK
jgi:CII-binding regulator of phage lambda lysogenization HflD